MQIILDLVGILNFLLLCANKWVQTKEDIFENSMELWKYIYKFRSKSSKPHPDKTNLAEYFVVAMHNATSVISVAYCHILLNDPRVCVCVCVCVISLFRLKIIFRQRLIKWQTRIWFGLDWLGWVWFYGISTIVGYLMRKPLYTYVLNIYDLVGLGWVLWHINHCRLFNAKYCLYINIKYIYDL